MWGGENKGKTLTEYLHFDGRLPLLVPVGGDALVRPFVLVPGIIQCEDRRWLIVKGDCDVWSVQFYPVPAWSEPFYLLGDAYNWENKQEQRVRNKASDIHSLSRRTTGQLLLACMQGTDGWGSTPSCCCCCCWKGHIVGNYFISVSSLSVKLRELGKVHPSLFSHHSTFFFWKMCTKYRVSGLQPLMMSHWAPIPLTGWQQQPQLAFWSTLWELPPCFISLPNITTDLAGSSNRAFLHKAVNRGLIRLLLCFWGMNLARLPRWSQAGK